MTAIGWVDERVVDSAQLDDRLATLRAGPGAAALPRPGTREARQLRRWAAHVLFTERICQDQAAHLALEPAAIEPLPAAATVQLGSITAAAWHTSAPVGAVCRALFLLSQVSGPDDQTVAETSQWHRVSWAEADAPLTPARRTSLVWASLGWTTLADLPPELAAALRVSPVGVVVGPLQSAFGWHVARIDQVVERSAPASLTSGFGGPGEGLRAFTRWLDQRRAESLVVAPGYEHPGDPRQPDNTHRH